jgi:hypothetical protein
MDNEGKLIDFLLNYATELEIEELDLHTANKDFDQADMVIELVMKRIV